MIALGLAVEFVAAILVIAGLLLGSERAAGVLWSAIGLVLLGLCIAMVGVRRARPPRRPQPPAVPAGDPPQS